MEKILYKYFKASYFLSIFFFQKNLPEAAQIFEKGCDLGNLGCCHNLSVMYRKGDGVTQSDDLAKKFMEKAQDIHEQLTKDRERIKFQEGVETAGTAPLKS